MQYKFNSGIKSERKITYSKFKIFGYINGKLERFDNFNPYSKLDSNIYLEN